MPLEAIEPRRLYRQIADQLRQLIDHGEYPVGSRLPTERELADMLGVSRPTVREALIALEVEGRLRIRVGSGIYVNRSEPASGRPSPLGRSRDRSRSCARARSSKARWRRRLPAGPRPRTSPASTPYLAEVAGLRSLSIERWVALDRCFHRAVVATLGNVVLLRTVGELFDQRINPYFEQLSRHIENDSTWRAAHVEHVAIRDAIAAHDPSDAREAMREHLRAVAPALLARFRRGAVRCGDNEGTPDIHGSGPAARQGALIRPRHAKSRTKRPPASYQPRDSLLPVHNWRKEEWQRTRLTRRQFVATTAAASATAMAAPFVHTAHAAGKLSICFWDHWVPGANTTSTDARQRMGGEGEGRGHDRLHHLAGLQEPSHYRRRGAGQVRSRHPRHADLVAAGPGQEPRAGRRHHGAS